MSNPTSSGSPTLRELNDVDGLRHGKALHPSQRQLSLPHRYPIFGEITTKEPLLSHLLTRRVAGTALASGS